MNNSNEEKFIANIRERLDRSIEDLEPTLNSKLNSIRESALKRQSEASSSAQDEELLIDSMLTRLDDQPELPDDVSRRLDQMRMEAVRRANTAPAQESLLGFAQNWLRGLVGNAYSIPVSMIATACLTVTVVTLFYTSSDPLNEVTVDEELLLVASAEDLELYENLDFYLWLEETGFEN